tara:strand:- start:298 stop:636 length:339 start_codon:yes stop_codon:yes gene_type:complete
MSNASGARLHIPSFEDLQSVNTAILKSPAGFRLFWTLDGPFPEAISVMKDRHCPDHLTPLFQKELSMLPRKSQFLIPISPLSSSDSMILIVGSLHGQNATTNMTTSAQHQQE